MPSFEISRTVDISAPPARVHALVDDFHRWPSWSPWDALDPQMQRIYGGSEHGVGATYSWKGNAKAGEGSMEITSSNPARIVIDLHFVKPFRASNVTTFLVHPTAEGTRLTWSMTGHRNLLMAVLGPLFVDRSLGKDFDRGLQALKAEAEG